MQVPPKLLFVRRVSKWLPGGETGVLLAGTGGGDFLESVEAEFCFGEDKGARVSLVRVRAVWRVEQWARGRE